MAMGLLGHVLWHWQCGLLAHRDRRRETSPRRGRRGPRGAVALAVGLLVLVACGREDGAPGVYPAHGTIEDVDAASGQVLIDHEDVAGLMPAMTMNFVVPDAAVLASLSPGQIVDFEIRFTGRSYEVASANVVGEAPFEEGWRRLGTGLVRTSPAPDFDLIDQEGRAVTLASLSDRVLVVDFIYTQCPGPCPVQTANQVALQKRIPEAIQAYVHFVSITLDPVNDRPEALRAYATARGVQLDRWSFLTGDPEVVAALVRQWGVGSVRRADGEIDHTLITFLVDHGRVMDRYPPRDGAADELLKALTVLAEARATAAREGTAP